MLWGVGLTALIAGAPFLAEAARRPMNRALQDRAPGEFADLPRGRTHYNLIGSEGAPLAICIHGLTTPSYIYAATARTLDALGYRVLTYDLYGRGFSDRPRGRQDTDFFLKQLRDLLDYLDLHEPITLVGFSMGGRLATAFAAEEGTRIEALILMASSGIAPAYQAPKDKIWVAPILGDWLMPVAGGWALRRELKEDVDAPTVIPDLQDRQAAEPGVRGFLPAVLSSRRHVLARNSDDDHRAIAGYGTPVLAFWGRDDPVISLSAIGRLSELNPNVHHIEIKGAGHALPQTHPSEIERALREFLVN